MTTSLVIITEIIAPYRVPVFNALAARPEVALHVIFLSENDPALRKWRIYKEEIKFSYQVLSSWRGRFGNRGMLLNRGLHSALDHIKPQVLVCGGYNFPAYWQAARWAKRRHTPFILWSESTTFDRRRRHRSTEFMKSRFLTSCSGFIVPGKSSSDYLQELGVAEFSIFIAPNAVDTSLFSRLGLAAKKHENQIRAAHDLPSRYFLYVGRLVKEKGIFDLLEAYCQLKPEIRKDVGLVFVGTGSQREELEKRASKVVVGSIQFLNFVQRDDLAAMYALAEVLIFPTHSDPWGLVVNEAMACGLPVITTNVAGCAADLVEHGWNGFVVERGNVADLASEMVRCAVDSTLRDTLGRRSRARIDEYSPAAWAQGVIEAARFVCGK